MQGSAVKLNVATVAALARFVIEMGHDSPYLDELAEHHSQTVNPTELAVSHTIFEAIASNIGADYVLVRLGLACSAYSADKVGVQFFQNMSDLKAAPAPRVTATITLKQPRTPILKPFRAHSASVATRAPGAGPTLVLRCLGSS